MNYFAPKSAAERYARGRPAFHQLVIERIKDFLSLTELLPRALDIGCGTGLSTVALKSLAREVVGADVAGEMVALARRAEGVSYLISAGEQLGLAGGMFDLITLSQAVHWLEQNVFLPEARRVLRAGGWLVAYDNYFQGEAQENESFERWHREVYLEKYPSPHNSPSSMMDEAAAGGDFTLLRHERHPHTIPFSLEALINYLVSQSNVIAAVEGGGEEIGEVRGWMRETLTQYCGDWAEASFVFDSPIWYFQRIG
ncbi:MAG: methyltransferase domain-containing protein [Acidobacteria bacterium]|nr:methyltransferase domain-containing protein [Acidobacteriota bacterium]